MGYLLGGLIVWVIRIGGSLGFGKEAMGLGDVHLMGAVGACLGWTTACLAVFPLAAVIGLYAIAMLAIGRYYKLRVQTADDYLLGGRTMNPLMIGLSLFATLTSTLSYLMLPGEMIRNGPMIFAQLTAFPVVMLVVVRRPHNATWILNDGYIVAAPIWRQIAQDIVLDWHLAPTP